MGLNIVLTDCNGELIDELTPSGGGTWTETIIHSFQGNLTDGAQPGPGALVFDAAGNLYGATTTGGTSFQGALFEFTPSAGGVWAESILHNFAAGRGGNFPSSFVTLDSAGNIYGTTLYDNASVYENRHGITASTLGRADTNSSRDWRLLLPGHYTF